ncbi:hypothetical protein [Staphylothermus hellenicus]|uniref:Uncharacterized protein n=1 Tax=Staphylothermus hellenicus (strain DSM 12710 / JCM 10830 / BK20S6-10-b1 / P8) TaxID=591019 RepID=D7D8B7_STAHD|nr:hypothetical protein [Staphylothermus hellenicus]ADI32013.1 hypothetical protein Shell_0905 [Staphylothermus hellenicus DSM 12710]
MKPEAGRLAVAKITKATKVTANQNRKLAWEAVGEIGKGYFLRGIIGGDVIFSLLIEWFVGRYYSDLAFEKCIGSSISIFSFRPQ